MIDQFLWNIASEKQRIYLKAVDDADGNVRGATRALGISSENSIRRSMKSLREKAAIQGYSPEHGMIHTAPDPFIVKGVSTYHKETPTHPAQWVKTSLDQERFARAIKEAVAVFFQDQPTLTVPKQTLQEFDTDIIPWIQVGDAHLGMLAHEAETGANFDIKICMREICAAIILLVGQMGTYDRVVLNDVGDFTHYENMAGVTEASGHALDLDGRFPKMIKAYSQIMRFMIDLLLTKANHVDVIVNQGNHSRTNDIWMVELLRVAYAGTDRVNVLNNDNIFIGYRMGKTFVLTHHSDKCKPARLADVVTVDFKKDYGETDFHYVDIGHIHHGMTMKEHPTVTVESWNQLANKDKWAHDGGYRSRQSISIVYRSRTYGEVGRTRLPIERVRDMIDAANTGTPHYRPQPRLAFVA
jgi:hypothetical protein